MSKKNEDTEKMKELSDAIRLMCQRDFGVLDRAFLCQSLSVINPKPPICVRPSDTLATVVGELQAHKVGAVLVTDEKDRLVGIFSERDCILKVVGKNMPLESTPVSSVMTSDPVAEALDTTTAYALNLMSQGGFRHLPLIDSEGVPVGIVSVKDIIDYLVETLNADLLNFQTA